MNFRACLALPLVIWLFSAVASIQAQDDFPKGAYAEPIRKISTIVVDANDKPVSDATIKLFARDRVTTHRAGPDGRLVVLIPQSMLAGASVFASDATGSQMTTVAIGPDLRRVVENEMRVVLKPALPIHVLVTNGNEVPLADVLVGEKPFVSTCTDTDGRAVLLAPRDFFHMIFAFDPKRGMNYDWLIQSKFISGEQAGAVLSEPVHLRLEGFQKPVTIAVTDQNGDPVEGAQVTPAAFRNPELTSMFTPAPFLEGEELDNVTDKLGIVVMDSLPIWNKAQIGFFIRKAGYSEGHVYFNPDRDARELKSSLIRRVLVEGRVEFPEGIPPKGMQLRFRGFQKLGNFAVFREEQIVNTDEQGKFEFEGVAKELYLPQIANSKVAFSDSAIFAAGVPDEGGELRFALRQPTLLKGKVTSGEDHEPVPDQVIEITNYVSDDPFPASEFNGRPTVPYSSKHVSTNSDGEFETSIGFGKYHIAGPVHFAPVEIVVGDQREVSVVLHNDLPPVGSLRGKVIDSVELQPAVGASVLLISNGENQKSELPGLKKRTVTDDEGKFALDRMFEPVTIYVASQNRTMAACIEVDAEQQIVKVKLLPVQTVTGRLIDGESGNPMANADIQIAHGISVGRSITHNIGGALVKTDAEGRFEANGMLPGLKFHVDFAKIVDGFPDSTQKLSEFTLEPSSKAFDLGDVIYVKPAVPKRKGK